MDQAALFARKAIDTVPRVLGLCDRSERSPTHGCCDRMFWHYRLIDWANARYQEAGLLFALAHSTNLPGNMFYGKASVRDWARAVWRFWLGNLNNDGSTCELYPNERSFCSTSFSSAAFVETALLLGGADEWKTELVQCENTMIWLSDNQNDEVANQMAGSLLALTGYAILTGDAGFAKLAAKRREEVIALAGENCAFPEYGGMDAGYQTITLGALARVFALTGDGAMAEIVKKGSSAIENLIGENGRVDSSKNSRSTQYVYPYPLVTASSAAVGRLADGLERGVVLNPSWMDDRYCIALAIDYFFAARETSRC